MTSFEMKQSFEAGEKYNQLMNKINSEFIDAQRNYWVGEDPNKYLEIVIQAQTELDEAYRLIRDHYPCRERLERQKKLSVWRRLLGSLHMDIKNTIEEKEGVETLVGCED